MVNRTAAVVERPTIAARLLEKLTTNSMTIRGLHRAVEALARQHGVPAPSFAAVHSYTYERANGATEPPALAATLIAEALDTPVAWLVLGEGSDAAPPTSLEALAGVAPDIVPESLREKFGALMSGYVPDLRLGGAAATRPAVMRILTAMIAQVQRERGEGAEKPVELLARLRSWRGDDALLDYLWLSIKAAAVIQHAGRVPKVAPARRKPRHK